MRRILYVVGIGLIFLGIYVTYSLENKETYKQSPEPRIEVQEPTPEELMEQATQKLIASAIAASSTDIENAKNEASKKVEDEIKLKIEKQVRDNIAETNDRRQQEITEKLSF